MIIAGVTMLVRPLNLIGKVFLARMLLPADFGAVAMAMLFVSSSYLFIGLGMSPAIIHSDLDNHKVAFHAFVITTISSVVITIFALANSAWLATVLGDPSIEPILRVLLINLVLTAWILVPTAILSKELKFGAIARSNLASKVVYLIVAVVLAWFGLGVWSLVIANVLESVVALIVVWWLEPSKDWLRPVPWDWSVFKNLMDYGLKATLSGIVRFFAWNWDDWFVGRQLGTTALGYYNRAFEFTNTTIQQFGQKVVGGVFFPAYANVKSDLERLQRAYIKSVQLVSTMVFPIGLGFLATASLLITVVLGEKWIPMIATFQVFSVMVLTRPVSANTSSVYQAVGKPQYNTYAGLVLSAVMVVFVLLLIPYGIAGVAVAVLVADVVGLIFNVLLTERLLPGSAVKTLKASLPALIAALIMFVIVVVSQNYLVASLGENVWSLTIVVVIGVLVYAPLIFLFQREFTKEVAQTLVQAFDRKGRIQRFITKRKPA